MARAAQSLIVTVLFDTSTLLLALDPDARPPLDPSTKKPLEHGKQRVEYLIRTLSKARTKVLIPAPVLAEVLVHAGDAANNYIQVLQQSPFRIVPFDMRAAIEWAESVAHNRSRPGRKSTPWAKVKFDHQITAIAKVEAVGTVYSDDRDIFSLAKQTGLHVVRSFDLPLDPDDRQLNLRLEEGNDSPPKGPEADIF